MVVSIFTPSLSTPHVYKKRPKFYHQTAQVYRLLHGIYSTEVNMVKQLQGLDSTSTLDAFVGVYTDLINDYCVDIQYDKGDEANQERLCYQKINFIWQLLQVLYFSGSKTEEKHCYGTQLMTWLNRLDKRAILQFDIQGVFNSPIPSRHASFWLMVYKLTLRGELDSLQQLVQVASERAPDLQEKAILQTVARTIRFFPGLTSSANNNITTDMKSRRKLWKSKATEGLQVLVGHEKDRSTLVSFATTVIHIMLGDITTICQYTLSSVESAVASIYYYSDNNTNTMTIGMINKITRRVHQLRDNNSKNEHDQHVGLLSLLKGDIYEALEQFAQLDWWLLAHAMDILEEDMLQHQRDGLLDNKPLQIHLGDGQHKVDMDARSFFVLTYAHALVTQDGMWETALDYMGTCGEVGKTEINKVISRISPTNDKILLGVIEYCTRCGLLDARQQIFEKLADQLAQQNSFVSAIRYYYLAGNYQKVEQVFKTCLYRYCDKQEWEPLVKLEPWYRTRCDGPYARLYFEYHDIVTLYKADKINDAANALIHLLLTLDSPMDVLLVVLVEGIIILDQSTLTLSPQTTDQLDQCFSRIATTDNKEGIRLLRVYSKSGTTTSDNEDDENSYLVSSLCEMFRISLNRMSTLNYL